MKRGAEKHRSGKPLTERQELVLRAVVASYVADAAPVGSPTLAHLLPVHLSSASIRNTMVELTAEGLIEKPHRSSGRVPTERGLRRFVDDLLEARTLENYQRRVLADGLADTEADAFAQVASALLSRSTHQLGFVARPRLARWILRHVSLVRLSRSTVLAVLVSDTGAAHRRLLSNEDWGDPIELDRIASALNERVAGRSLVEVRETLRREAREMRSHASGVMRSAFEVGSLAFAPGVGEDGQLVIGTRTMLLDQPEFQDRRRLRDFMAAIETKELLVSVLDRMLEEECGVNVAIGEEVGEPTLENCAVVAATYGDAGSSQGVLGVLGPSRMDYGRVIPVVECLSELVTERLSV